MNQRMARELSLDTPHLRLTAKHWSAEAGQPVLGLHGWLDNANTFDRIAPLLPQLDLVALDLPGHGRSDHRPAGMRYHYTDYLDDVMAAADALGWEQFTLLGHSMGAGIGCLAASAFPDRIQRLIIIEGMGAVTGEKEDVSDCLRRSVEAMKPKAIRRRTVYHNFEAIVRARAAAGKIKKESAERLMQRAVQRDGDVYHWLSDRRLKWPYPQYFTNQVMLAFLKAITAPVLLITAQDGILRKRPYFKSRCEVIPDLHMVTLPGHHHLHLDEPEPVAAAINSFLLSTPTSDAPKDKKETFDDK